MLNCASIRAHAPGARIVSRDRAREKAHREAPGAHRYEARRDQSAHAGLRLQKRARRPRLIWFAIPTEALTIGRAARLHQSFWRERADQARSHNRGSQTASGSKAA